MPVANALSRLHLGDADPTLEESLDVYVHQLVPYLQWHTPRNSPRPPPLLFSVMVNSLAKEVPDRCKFVDDLTIGESCFRNLISDPMSILNEIGSEALDLDMTVNPSKSMIMPICFLKSSPCFS